MVDVGDGLAVAFKVESHNHPSAVEPFQGAATGVGGILRDVFAVGARPIAVLDSLRFGELSSGRSRYLLDGAVRGIGHYGNSIGVPTVGGEVYFEGPYEQNCLVNAMCLGIARHEGLIRSAAAGVGNHVVLFGARTGRDGIGGASVLASAELDEADEAKRPSVQIGDPFEEKRLLECCLELLERGTLRSLQDLGAAGLSSSSSEMASKGEVGIDLDVSQVPLREADMEPFEVMVSESQERMLCVVEPERLAELEEVCDRWEVRHSVIGSVTDSGHLRVFDGEELVGDMPVPALVDDCPLYDLEPEKPAEPVYPAPAQALSSRDPRECLLALMGSPNLSSRRPLFEQYDSIVQSRTVRRPEECDAAVLQLAPDGGSGAIAVSIDGNGRRVACDPYTGAVEAVLECAANLACAGAEPLGLTNCLNFGNPEKPHVAWQLSEAVRGLADACRALEVPVVGGNVSLYNEGPDGPIYPTPVVGMVGRLPDAERSAPIGFAREGDVVGVLRRADPAPSGQRAGQAPGRAAAGRPARGRPGRGPRLARGRAGDRARGRASRAFTTWPRAASSSRWRRAALPAAWAPCSTWAIPARATCSSGCSARRPGASWSRARRRPSTGWRRGCPPTVFGTVGGDSLEVGIGAGSLLGRARRAARARTARSARPSPRFARRRAPLVPSKTPGSEMTRPLELRDGPRDECGVFGVYAPGSDVARLAYFALFALQHRGQESAGIATCDDGHIMTLRDLGLVSQVFDEQSLRGLHGGSALGHVRYSTTGSSAWENAQPVYRSDRRQIALAHNGNLINAVELHSELVDRGVQFRSTSDSEIIAALLSTHEAESIADALADVIPRLQGAFSTAVLTTDSVVAFRDPAGLRPLSLGRLGDHYCVASESCAFDIIGAELVREVEPGEMIRIDERRHRDAPGRGVRRGARSASSSTSTSRGPTRCSRATAPRSPGARWARSCGARRRWRPTW